MFNGNDECQIVAYNLKAQRVTLQKDTWDKNGIKWDKTKYMCMFVARIFIH